MGLEIIALRRTDVESSKKCIARGPTHLTSVIGSGVGFGNVPFAVEHVIWTSSAFYQQSEKAESEKVSDTFLGTNAVRLLPVWLHRKANDCE